MRRMVSLGVDPLVQLRRTSKGEGEGKAKRQKHPGQPMEGAAKLQRTSDAHLIN